MNTIEVQEKIWSVRENWDMLKPYLNDKDVQKVLDEAMTEFSEGNPNRKMWTPGDAPWEYTTSSYWVERIDEKVENDEQYCEELEVLDKEWVSKTNLEDDDLWDNDEYRNQWGLLFDKYYKKHSPKEGTIEYYQFVHGCHWINVFTAKLIEKALNVETDIWQTETHTVVEFVKDDVCYCADILIEWETTEELCKFMYKNIES
ncbi:hypothetical protein [Bacillus toyonensis]|uniref:Uncharacterized protein n=1 Tax=Bacillus toyonensis TaxID=155322 RepID=A0A2C4QYD9_9BACI|nr:hypothetical protein [Bacillus toyonensis]PHD69789.1 hypothetical protein COF40_15120 [Bacillus toyonensis]